MSNNQTDKIQKIVDDCASLLAKKRKKVAFAESATAGYLMAAFACSAHSEVLSGGIVCYDASVKTALLAVDPKMIDQFTAESIPVTEAIAVGLISLISADYHIGITGLLKPGGSETAEKPVGTIYTSIVEHGEKLTNKTHFPGPPEQIRDQCLETICMLLIEKMTLPHL